MTDGAAWRGNWKSRIYERIRERGGYDSLTAFVEARPAVPLSVLADELGEDVAAIQLLSGLLAEAERRQRVRRFERDVLARELAEGLPNGWPAVLDDANRFEVAMALARWVGYVPEGHQENARRVMSILLASPPPPGWHPLGPDDALLLSLLPDEEV